MKVVAPPAADRLLELIDRFAGRRVVVLGDLVADEFVYGDIARVSREAPVLILEHRRTVVTPGGGGNAIANLHALEARPVPVGVVGNDASGRYLLDWFRREGIPGSGVRPARAYVTPSKSRVLAGGVHTRRQQIVRLDRGATHRELEPTVAAALARRLASAVGRAHGILVADYGYGAATPGILAAAIGEADASRIPVTVDSRSRVDRFRRATACTPNQEELEQVLDIQPLASDQAVEDAARRLLRRSGDRAILVTRGAKGMSLLERGRPPAHIPAFGSDEVADVTGAGDTVIAVFTLAHLAGASLLEAAHLANYAAGLVVMKAGTATVTRGELSNAVREAEA